MAEPRTSAFRGRARERKAVDGLLDRVHGGESAVLVIRGEAGIGKTALMRYCARQASGCRLVQIAGVESETELPLAALHQLCGTMLSRMAALPEPQQRALRVAFGLAAGTAPDRFIVGLAVLSLLAENAAARPLVCLVDDAQWLDEASSQVLGFVGRRLLAEPVVLLFAVREAADEQIFPGLPALTVEGLTDEDARALLTAAVPGHLDERVRDRIIAETSGNPLALLELARGMSEAELAGGFAGPPEANLPGHLQDQLQDHYLRQVQALPEPTRQLLLLAAADPTGDATLLWRAAQTLGLGRDAAAAADAEQLLTIGSQVRFRHPLVRSAAYTAGSPEDRRAAHLKIAAATDVHEDPERRVWHLAAGATGPDEDVATALEQAAVKTQARAGLAAAAAFLQRFESADGHLREALRIREELGDRRGENLSLANLGLLSAAAGDLREGQRYARLALDRGEAVDDGPGVAGALLDLAVVELFAGERHAARVLVEQAVEAFQPQGYARLEAWARLLAAELARDDSDSEALARHGRAAAELFTRLGSRIGMSRAVALPRGRVSNRPASRPAKGR
jgi:tetratricopeptide (TPR) repeat protein